MLGSLRKDPVGGGTRIAVTSGNEKVATTGSLQHALDQVRRFKDLLLAQRRSSELLGIVSRWHRRETEGLDLRCGRPTGCSRPRG